MNYEFFLRKVATLTPETHQQLLALARTTELDPRTSYFVPGVHPGMVSGAFPIAANPSVVPGVIWRVLDELDPVLPKRAALSYLINRLGGNGLIREHTDATGGAMSTGRTIVTQHLVHISLCGNATYLFRRDRRLANDEFEMENGSVYAYNNYVYHSVENRKEEDRFNMILYYNDPEWLIKRQLYGRLNVKHNGY